MGKSIKGMLLMGGSGERFGSATPKQFHRLAGKKVYQYTLEQFLKITSFEQILLICPKEWIEEVHKEIQVYNDPRIKVAIGGTSRQESSFLGLLACGDQTDYVVIHDAVRPFVSLEILQSNIEKAIVHGAVDTCIPSTDTIVHSETGNKIDAIPPRQHYWRGQTPQSFHYLSILQAHIMAQKDAIENISDDCSLMMRLGHPVHILLGSEENLKITTELDLFLAEQLLRLKQTNSPSVNAPLCLKGKRFAITGGNGGIGQALADLLQEEGAIALLISRTSPYSVDLTHFDSTQKTFDRIYKEHGTLDGLINCIGQLKLKSIKDLTVEEIESLISTNLTSVVYSCKCARIKEKGHIINLSSSSYVRGKKDYALYSSAKAAVVNFTQGLAEEREELFIHALVPQRTNTSMRRLNFPDECVGDLLDPKEVAQEIINTLKQQSTTGSLIEVRKNFRDR